MNSAAVLRIDVTRRDRDRIPMRPRFHQWALHTSTWSVAGFLAMADAGQVVAEEDSAFMS